ncbi:DMT family transporter [Aestuariicoccus sp. MJ-SS9]|uniref:DMT family transporter n=1 Tax=Aestuariicoccus sp. MJ-SS9 TaxID=3079855 RepID=UPI00291242AC|nr:DMT family transporter [Aestuariicoccus sp. MJ-SS9]MDU8910714.1 DMT family transporter [Aestuariicoccus sp. MJ-SS9]
MSPLRGVAFKLASVFLFVIMASLIKASAAHVPTGQAVFFRSFFAMPVIVAWLLWRGDLATGLRAERPLGHVWRGVIGVSAMGCGFAALGLLPLPEVTALGYAAPLLTVLFAAALLGERLRAFRLTAVGIGLVGVLIVLWPRLGAAGADRIAVLGVVLVLVSATLRALAQIHIRKLVQTEQTSAIVFYFSLTATVFSLATIPFGWVWPTPAEAAMLVGAGLIGGVAQILITSAYRHAEAALLAPFDYASILFAILIGYVVFAEVPTLPMLTGSSVVILAGVVIIWRERQLGLKRGQARPGMTPQG